MLRDQRVLLVDDHPIIRRGLRAMLEEETWVGAVVEAATAAEAVRQAVTVRPDVIAMDITLPDGDGVEVTRRIVQAVPEVRILMVTMTDDEAVVRRALHAGAHGYVLKDTDPDAVVESLRTVAEGAVVLGPGVGAALLATLRTSPQALPPPFDRLTARERDIVGYLAAGQTSARIGRQLGLTEKTVRNQLTGVFAKLGVTDRVQAALLAQNAGIRPSGSGLVE